MNGNTDSEADNNPGRPTWYQVIQTTKKQADIADK